MLLYKNKIVVTGGTGRFASSLKKVKNRYLIYYPSKTQLNILKEKSVFKYLKNKKPKYLIHLAGLSRPMSAHNKDIKKSIDLNIIGTANIVKVCERLKIKIIYFSSSYVYPGKKGGYKENDPVLPINNYAWSKLGGECSVKLYKNSLIVRASMTEKPFIHKAAFSDFLTNFIFHEEIAPKVFKLLNLKGIINFGGKSQSVFQFAKKYNPKIRKVSCKKVFGVSYPSNTSMSLKKFKKILKK
tara:strand:- start:393 stop:1115 length:723 start_codon:yes stop_codon:yes gene_type:complete